MPIMIWIAVVVEAGIQNWIDFGILLFIQFVKDSEPGPNAFGEPVK